MLVEDIRGNSIDIGDEVILWDGKMCCKAILIKETKSSVGYNVYGWKTDRILDYIYWIRKGSKPFNNMYKI